MGRINWGRVVLGGVLWYLVFSIFWAAAWPFVGRVENPVFEEMNRPFEVTPQWLALWVAVSLVMGIFSIWFYAAIRPRYGPGPRTALCAGLALWLAMSPLPTLVWGSVLRFPARMIAVDVGANLVAIVAATLVGAWAYKE
jgi:hypothetical protein